jgi:hypothetical protein
MTQFLFWSNWTFFAQISRTLPNKICPRRLTGKHCVTVNLLRFPFHWSDACNVSQGTNLSPLHSGEHQDQFLLYALRFAEEYRYLLAGWNQHRRDEQRYPDDFVNKKLTYQDIERTLCNHDNEKQAWTSIQVNQVAAVVASS